MYGADPINYLDSLLDEMAKKWPENRTINIVCHGHSVPAGYFATPFVNTFKAYPHLLHQIIKERFPYAVVNVIVTAIGGENSLSGSERFEKEVLNHAPDLITIDYALNDRGLSLEQTEKNWRFMIEKALERGIKVILVSGTLDRSYFSKDEMWTKALERVELVRKLADEYKIGLADSFKAWLDNIHTDSDLVNMLSHVNHPNEKAHALIANELGRFFLAR